MLIFLVGLASHLITFLLVSVVFNSVMRRLSKGRQIIMEYQDLLIEIWAFQVGWARFQTWNLSDPAALQG